MSTISSGVRPRDEAELAQLLGAPGGAYELRAGGTKCGIGRPVRAPLLDLSALGGIVDYQPGELVLTAGPATPLQEIERLLRAQGQRLGFEPPGAALLEGTGDQTLGGVLMANSSGSRRVSAGSARDHFIGLRAVNGRGEVFIGGGRVVKNVTGFDLPKALAGSWGTLAVLTQVTVRVMPLTEFERTLILSATSAQSAVQLCSQALGSMFEVSCAAFVPGQGVALRLEGLASSVQTRSDGLLAMLGGEALTILEGEQSAQQWRSIGAAESLSGCAVIWRLSVAPSEAAAVIETLQPARFLLDWGGGLIWLGATQLDAQRVRAAMRGGHATLVRAPLAQRDEQAAFQPPPPAVAAIAARLKAAFDPHNRLNPGRLG